MKYDFSNFELPGQKTRKRCLEIFRAMCIHFHGEQKYFPLEVIHEAISEQWRLKEFDKRSLPSLDELQDFLDDEQAANPNEYKKNRLGYCYTFDVNPTEA